MLPSEWKIAVVTPTYRSHFRVNSRLAYIFFPRRRPRFFYRPTAGSSKTVISLYQIHHDYQANQQTDVDQQCDQGTTYQLFNMVSFIKDQGLSLDQDEE